MKPLLADDYVESKLVFPLIGQPKIDGVRGLNMTGKLTGRSLKPFKNNHTTSLYSHSALVGLDGEFAAERETHPDLCRLTTSAIGTINGEPYLLWWLFDYVTTESHALPYSERLHLLQRRMGQLQGDHPELWHHLRVIPYRMLHSLEELNAYDEENLLAGFEGTCLRDPTLPHKQGRSGKKPILWRIKRFVDFEFDVHTILEGEENQNEAQINELGLQFRSSHQENKVANGMIGAMLGTTLDVVKDPVTGEVLFEKGTEVKVGAGCLSHDQRKYYFENPNEFKSKVHKAKFFPKGLKDKPRFPTWQTFRDVADIS